MHQGGDQELRSKKKRKKRKRTQQYNKTRMKRMREGVDKNGYRIIYKPDSPYSWSNGFIFEHRLVVSEYLNRKLKITEHVHHKNGNKLDNSLDNLRVMLKESHMGLHKIERYLPREYRNPLCKVYTKEEIEEYKLSNGGEG